MARVVLDANIIVSAAFGGTPLKALARAFHHEVYVSPMIRAELLALPTELGSKLSPDRSARLRRYLKILLLKAELSEPGRRITVCRDPKDDTYLSLCLSIKADCLVTGDADLLALSKDQLSHVGLHQLAIVTPRKFLTLKW